MPRALRLLGLLGLAAAAGGCADSYRFQDKSDSNEVAQDAMPTAIGNGAADEISRACGDECRDDAQSSGGG